MPWCHLSHFMRQRHATLLSGNDSEEIPNANNENARGAH